MAFDGKSINRLKSWWASKGNKKHYYLARL